MGGKQNLEEVICMWTSFLFLFLSLGALPRGQAQPVWLQGGSAWTEIGTLNFWTAAQRKKSKE